MSLAEQARGLLGQLAASMKGLDSIELPKDWDSRALGFLGAAIPVLNEAERNAQLVEDYRKRAEKWLDAPKKERRTLALAQMAASIMGSAIMNRPKHDYEHLRPLCVDEAEALMREAEKRGEH